MKKLLVGILVTVVVLIIAALVAPFLIPTDVYSNRIVLAVTQATGRAFTIKGPVRLSFLPQLEIDAHDVTLANAPGMTDPAMLTLSSLEVRLRVLPLLHGDVEIGHLALTDPVISLEVAKDGRPNWAFTPPSTAAPAPARTPAPSAAPPVAPSAGGGMALQQLSLGDVHLSGGQVTYRDDRAGTVRNLSAIDMTLSLPDLDQPLAADGSAVWNGEKITLALGVAKPRALLGGAQSTPA